ncbi:MAG: TauD/TfdA family dioxygenase, partial [Pelagibacterales bacterium]|nr:TauD/TfdA family dioxygenase [Pelagibacterales bacterium]
RDKKNGQRLISVSDIPVNTYIQSATLDKKGKKVIVNFLPKKKQVKFSTSWLKANAYDKKQVNSKVWLNTDLKTWSKKSLKHIPVINYKAAKSNKKLLIKWLKSLNSFGFAKIIGCEKKTGTVIKIAKLFGYVRETNYGKWFDVKSKTNAVNLAYTNLGLQAHTDNPYRNPVPTIQILHCIKNSTKGGDTKVVDGFRAALRLEKENKKYFDLLSKYCSQFEFKGKKNIHLKSRFPMIALSPDRELTAIHFNNRSIGPITDVPYHDMSDYYKAYRKFSKIIDNPQMAISFKLKPGECFIVDNTRVLHARTAYSGTGSRWLQGCYADKDGLLSTILTKAL